MRRIYLLLITTQLMIGCMTQIGNIEEDTSIVFDMKTVEEVNVEIKLSYHGVPVPGVLITLWNGVPSNSGRIVLKGLTNENGIFQTIHNLPNAQQYFVLQTQYIGLPDLIKVSRNQLMSGITISEDRTPFDFMDQTIHLSSANTTGRVTNNYTELGNYDNNGVPNYLLNRDLLSAELLSFINASLPESRPVPIYHPKYLDKEAKSNIDVQEEADVWMTFVHEGAGYRNILGFYTYPTSSPPTSVSDIEPITIAFPNVSFKGSGGGLNSGDKVYLGRFEPGTTIGFCLFANGWNGAITEGSHQVYSNNILNPEISVDKRQHTVLLWDELNELFLVGFEDLNRDNGSDDDFNDAIFYITANPIEALSAENVNPIDQPVDSDGDGVNDVYDEYPLDASLAYHNFYPAEQSYGTFAFEDQWPRVGDYDFNDLVVDYQFKSMVDANNRIVRLNANYIIKAVGAGYQNGFGVQFGIHPNGISNVTGSDVRGSLHTFSENGTESNQSKAVIIVSDNVHQGFDGFGFINTHPNMTYQQPDTISIGIDLSNPTTSEQLGSAPYNSFLIINQNRGRELHLPSYPPTDLADPAFFGQHNDNTDVQEQVFYNSKVGLPWGMNLPVSFEYPNEKVDVREGYLHFDRWAKSGGFTYLDWYSNHSGYRNQQKLFNK
ncbi:MAG: LruC domain-containing protein [Cyclobacteriaceae bacterium]